MSFKKKRNTRRKHKKKKTIDTNEKNSLKGIQCVFVTALALECYSCTSDSTGSCNSTLQCTLRSKKSIILSTIANAILEGIYILKNLFQIF